MLPLILVIIEDTLGCILVFPLELAERDALEWTFPFLPLLSACFRLLKLIGLGSSYFLSPAPGSYFGLFYSVKNEMENEKELILG